MCKGVLGLLKKGGAAVGAGACRYKHALPQLSAFRRLRSTICRHIALDFAVAYPARRVGTDVEAYGVPVWWVQWRCTLVRRYYRGSRYYYYCYRPGRSPELTHVTLYQELMTELLERLERTLPKCYPEEEVGLVLFMLRPRVLLPNHAAKSNTRKY